MQPLSQIALNKQEGAGTCSVNFEDAKKHSKTYQLLNSTVFTCDICVGKGHEYFECPTKKKLDKFARKNGDSVYWGAYKFHAYYKNLNQKTREIHGELAKKLASKGIKKKYGHPKAKGKTLWLSKKKK